MIYIFQTQTQNQQHQKYHKIKIYFYNTFTKPKLYLKFVTNEMLKILKPIDVMDQ